MIDNLLRKHGISLDKEKGQHFLEDERTLDKILEAAELDGDETVLEIGAGIGTLTRELAEHADQVITYEVDDRLLPALEDALSAYDNVDIRNEDILDADLPEYDICVANLPFHISSPIIERLADEGRPAVIMVQKEFADRLTAEPGSKAYSRLTVFAQYHFIPVFITDVPRTLFTPPPRTDAAVVKLFPREKQFGVEDEEFFFTIVRALFVHSKKKTRNAFYDSRHMLNLDKDQSKNIRDELPHSEKRVRELTLRELAEITAFLKEQGIGG